VIVQCKQCHSKFKLSSSEYSAINQKGRVLKCGNCYHMWLVQPNDFSSQISDKPTDNVLLENLQNNHRAAVTLLNMLPNDTNFVKITNTPLMIKLFFYVILFCSLTIALIANKNYILQNIPPLKPVLLLMGLSDTNNLTFEKITITKSSFVKDKPLVISGYVVNNSGQPLIVPDLRIQFISDKGEVLYSMIYDLPVKLLAAGEKVKISNRFSDYPRDQTHNIIIDIGNYLEFFMR
jgi:predicted Zn finger-like uncharacterized protein